jgi:hypothetical protein
MKRYLRKHRKLKKTRATRKRKYYEKLREQSSKMVKENKKNLLYGSGITGVFAEDRPPEPAASLPAATITGRDCNDNTRDKQQRGSKRQGRMEMPTLPAVGSPSYKFECLFGK